MTQKIFLLGAGPIPSEKEGGMVNAGGLRTEQFLSVLRGKYDISLCTLETRETTKKQEKTVNLTHDLSHGLNFRYISVSKSSSLYLQQIREEMSAFQPDIVVGINTFPSSVAAQVVPDDIPFWADLNGWVMGEMQAQASSMESNAFLSRGYEMEKTVLTRADKISVVSTPQKYATYGELGFLGRLTKENFEYPFVEVVPNANYSPLIKGGTGDLNNQGGKPPCSEKEKNSQQGVMTPCSNLIWRGKIFPEDAFTLLWLGGFNAWADEETLFMSLEKAMVENEKIHFVCTGGILKGIDEKSFPQFQKRVENSKYKNRFHFLGWIPAEQIPQIFKECDAGINVDKMCVETEFGARNRLNEFLRNGLPIITTKGSEIANIIGEKKAGVTCSSGDSVAVAKAILELSHNKEKQKECQENGFRLIENQFSAIITLESFLSWVPNAIRAPDNGKRENIERPSRIRAGIHYLRQRGLRAFFQKCRQLFFSKIGSK